MGYGFVGYDDGYWVMGLVLDGLGYGLKRNKGKRKIERKEIIIIIEVKTTIRTIIINNNYILI